MTITLFVQWLGWILIIPLTLLSCLAVAAMVYASFTTARDEFNRAAWRRERKRRTEAAAAARDAAMDAVQAELDKKPKKTFEKKEKVH